jgi:hypothetical protein
MTRTAAAVTLALSLPALVHAQNRNQNPPPAAPGPRFVAIGCLARQGTASAPRYTVTDPRGTSPTTYRLTGDAALLAQHVGHTVEVSGPLTSASSAQPVLRVDRLVWIASKCKGQ